MSAGEPNNDLAVHTSFLARCRTTASLLLAGLVAIAALAGCSGNTSEAGPTTPPAVTSTIITPTPTPSPTASPTPTARPFELDEIPVPPEPKYPPAMLIADAEGAQAFVAYLFEEMAWMQATLDTTEFRGVSAVNCIYCSDQVERVTDGSTKSTGVKVRFHGWEVGEYPDVASAWVVRADITVSQHRKWDLDTLTVTTVPATTEPETIYFGVRHDNQGWVLLAASSDRPVDIIGEAP